METTQLYHETRFNFFAPFDFETYTKIKRIKAVRNISEIRSIRYHKWARKLPKNRKTTAPVFCELFYTPASYMDYYVSWNDDQGKYVRTDVEIEYAKKTELNDLIVQLWEYAVAKPFEKDIEPIPEWSKTLEIDKLYNECEEFYKLHYEL